MASSTSRPPPWVSPFAASTSVSASTRDDPALDDPGTVQFTSMKALLNTIDSTTRDSLTVTHVSLDRFTNIERTREKQRRKFRFRYYDSKSQILIITIPTGLHEQLHKVLYNEYLGQIHDMGLKKSWIDIASTTLPPPQGHSRRRGKEGDSTGGPLPERITKCVWPTLVIVPGYSESLRQLHMDMHRWFDISNHEVKIVLLAKFDGTTILLEKWEEETQPLEPVLRQSIAITRNTTTNPISYNVTGALVLSFRLLFLRDPGPGEGDFVFGVPELENYAERVWFQV
ncbi:hypothetical protein QBC47DRAFT_388479 [Echria macrotheca]|uniref:Uncharacterized protein n=1 Tax=Echria macrotheca TaxID=438768 RepID=A0AAJ0B676_9PEZI|nr:hypothetical protein QBC47DRAFT_388479 [Echria macrotheca]